MSAAVSIPHLLVDFQVQLAHARNNGLLALGVDVHAERGVLPGCDTHFASLGRTCLVKRLMALPNFSRSLACFGLMLSDMTGSGTNMDVSDSLAPSVNVSPLLQSTPKSAQISPERTWRASVAVRRAPPHLVDIDHGVGVHAHQPRHAHFLVLARVVNRVAALDAACACVCLWWMRVQRASLGRCGSTSAAQTGSSQP